MQPVAAAVLSAFAMIVASSAHAQTVKLKSTPFPDGTGSIGVAPGWQVTDAYRGAVTCTGPKDAAVVLKLPWVILRPESSVATLPTAAEHPTAPAGNIPEALRQILAKKAGATLKRMRGKRLPDLPSGSPAYLIHYEYTQNGKAMTGIGYFAALDYGPGQPVWQLYSSAVLAPTAQFAKLAPTMLAMWKTWRPNGQAPTEGSTSATFDKIINDRQKSYERIQAQFREQL